MRPNGIKIKSSKPDEKPIKNVIKEEEEAQTNEANVHRISGTVQNNKDLRGHGFCHRC